MATIDVQLRALLDVVDAARRLTRFGVTKDDQPVRGCAGGQTIVGTVGWVQLQEALANME